MRSNFKIGRMSRGKLAKRPPSTGRSVATVRGHPCSIRPRPDDGTARSVNRLRAIALREGCVALGRAVCRLSLFAYSETPSGAFARDRLNAVRAFRALRVDGDGAELDVVRFGALPSTMTITLTSGPRRNGLVMAPNTIASSRGGSRAGPACLRCLARPIERVSKRVARRAAQVKSA